MTTFAAGGGKIDAEGFLKLSQFLFRAGYTQGLNVTQRAAGTNMSVDINPVSGIGGGALVVTSAGIPYFGWIDTSTAPNATVATAHATLSRIDSVVGYVDLTTITSSTTNNQGAFKFIVVSGTAGSGSAPNSAAIQSAITAAGATGSPYTVLATITLPAAASTVVNAYITDARIPSAYQVPYLYGGSSNTKGHLVPNLADGTVVVSTGTNNVTAPMLATNAITLGYAQITSGFSSSSTTIVAVTGLSVAVTIPAGGRKIRITAFAQSFSAPNITSASIYIYDGTTSTVVGYGVDSIAGVGYFAQPHATAVVTPSAGSKTYGVGMANTAGVSTTLNAAANGPSYILVEAI